MFRAILTATVLMSATMVHADTYLKDKPSGELTASDARKLGKTKTIYKCNMVKQGADKPKNVSGKKAIYVDKVGEGLDDVGDILDVKGGRAWKCKAVEYDKSKAAFVKSDDE